MIDQLPDLLLLSPKLFPIIHFSWAARYSVLTLLGAVRTNLWNTGGTSSFSCGNGSSNASGLPLRASATDHAPPRGFPARSSYSVEMQHKRFGCPQGVSTELL
jgi:hypothetical protein